MEKISSSQVVDYPKSSLCMRNSRKNSQKDSTKNGYFNALRHTNTEFFASISLQLYIGTYIASSLWQGGMCPKKIIGHSDAEIALIIDKSVYWHHTSPVTNLWNGF
jgi:hypothetical protein